MADHLQVATRIDHGMLDPSLFQHVQRGTDRCPLGDGAEVQHQPRFFRLQAAVLQGRLGEAMWQTLGDRQDRSVRRRVAKMLGVIKAPDLHQAAQTWIEGAGAVLRDGLCLAQQRQQGRGHRHRCRFLQGRVELRQGAGTPHRPALLVAVEF